MGSRRHRQLALLSAGVALVLGACVGSSPPRSSDRHFRPDGLIGFPDLGVNTEAGTPRETGPRPDSRDGPRGDRSTVDGPKVDRAVADRARVDRPAADRPPPAATCSDGVKNGAETDTDCGGSSCPKCGDGKACGAGSDCANGACSGGACTALAAVVCTGQTSPTSTDWRQYSADGIYVDVSTAGCGHAQAPLFFTSLGGDAHWRTRGATSIYAPTATGFRVYINSPSITPLQASSWKWHLGWAAIPNNLRSSGLCTGKTPEGSSGWQQYGVDGLYLDVNTGACGYSQTPFYSASLGGDNHWLTTGVTAIYAATPTGFRVYVRNNTAITPAGANALKWHVNWMASPGQSGVPKLCTGKTVAGATAWQQYGADGIFVDISTSACGFPLTPLILTSLGGDTEHWTARGVNAIYKATATGFTIYLNWPGITPAAANTKKWFVAWAATPYLDKASRPVCSGSTPAGTTAWQQYSPDGIFVSLDTAACSFSQVPVYLPSLGGNSNHWTANGVTAVYLAAASSLRTYLGFSAITPALANSYGWRMSWLAAPNGVKSASLCTGKTTAGSTAWQVYSADGVFVDVSTSGCGFTKTPLYFSSLGGDGHWQARGASAIYSPTATGFRAYVNLPGITPATANANQWHVAWAAVPDQVHVANLCTGRTLAGSTVWQQYNTDGIYTDIDTTACGFGTTPLYLTSIGGDGSHWTTRGAHSIYSPTPTGFRVYVHSSGVTPSFATSNAWHINWLGRAP